METASLSSSSSSSPEEESEDSEPKTEEKTLPAPLASKREGEKMRRESQLGFWGVELGERRGVGRSYGVGRGVVARLGRTIFPPDLNSVSRFGGRETAYIVTQYWKMKKKKKTETGREGERCYLGWISRKRERGEEGREGGRECWWWGELQV